MGFERFDIQLDSSVAVFFPGQIVSGKVRIWNATSEKSFKGLFLECSGLAKVFFFIGRGKRRRKRESNEQYFSFRSCLTETLESFDVPIGQNEYPFWFTLPANIPSSYESNEGNVRYTVCAVLKRSWKTDLKFKTAFTVNTIVDLNLNPEAQVVGKVSKRKTNNGFFCSSGPLSSNIWVEKTGYVPGEDILFCADVDNQTGNKFKASRIQLVETATYRTKLSTKVSERVLHELTHKSFREVDIWDHVVIPVPPVAPSGLPFCTIIDVSYKLKFGLCRVGYSKSSLTLELNVIIGNVPLRRNLATLEGTVQPSAPLMPSPLDQSAPPHEDLPPPNYEQAMLQGTFQGDQDPGDYNDGAPIDYNPRYATYKRQ